MSTHSLCFGAKIRKNRYTPTNPNFAIYKWGIRGYIIHGNVILICDKFIKHLQAHYINHVTFPALID